MSFQSSVPYDYAFGVPGEIKYDNGAYRVIPGFINSANAAYNIVGSTIFTSPNSGGTVAAGGAIALGNTFFGLLANPKVYASFGTSGGGPLAPTMTLPNLIQAEFLLEGYVVVSVPGACNIGDILIYNIVTGAIATIPAYTLISGSIAVTSGVLTVTALAAGGYIGTGLPLTGTGIPAGTMVTGQVTGVAGSTGTYNTNIVTAVAAFTNGSTPNQASAGSGLVPAASGSGAPGAFIAQFPQTSAGIALARFN